MANDESKEPNSPTSDDSSSEDESDSESVELLVAGRERRKTAGNRYDREIVLEEAVNEDEEDEVNLLFADNEDEEDEEFKSDEDDEDAEMSDDDGDDQGPNTGADDLEGNKNYKNKPKAERSKKRKADLALTTVASLRKKPRIEPTYFQQSATPLKPSKRKERLTWIPGRDRAEGRTSLRKQTIAHREVTIARLKASEAHSKKMKALKEQRNRERAKDAPKELTQADRLAEAERVERRNAKSLNRWEAMEKKRAEEQAAKLAALKNRKLEGPVITWWSGKAKWIGPRLNKVGSRDATGIVMEGGVETKKRGRKPKAFHEQMAAAREAENRAQTMENPVTDTRPIGDDEMKSHNEAQVNNTPERIPLTTAQGPDNSVFNGGHETASDGVGVSGNTIAIILPSKLETESPTIQVSVSQQSTEHVEDSIISRDQRHDITATTTEQLETTQLSEAKSQLTDMQKESTSEAEAKAQVTGMEKESTLEAETSLSAPLVNDTAPGKIEGSGVQPPTENITGMELIPSIQPNLSNQSIPVSIGHLPPPPSIEYSTRNLMLLKQFDDLSTEAKQEYGVLQHNRKMVRPLRQNPMLCPITTLPARYRDPSTGIGYANKFAYQKLQELKQHQFTWSSMLGCYVGRTGATVARGVPDGFSHS